MKSLSGSLNGIFMMLRKIHKEQKKQTKMLQAIESSLEQKKVSTTPISKKDLSEIGKQIIQKDDL